MQQNTGQSAQKVINQGSKALSERSAPEIRLLMGLLLVVCAAVLAVHWPALSARALSFDDDQYLTENSLVQNPSWKSAQRFLTEVLEPSTVEGYYQPLTMISLMADYALGGRADNLRPFHSTSLVLHVVNTALVIVLLYMLFGQAWVAAGVGLLFGLHPMTVEPIPWVGERKTLLTAFFALWCLILYVRYARKSDWRLYVGCMVTYVLALMSKPTSLPLPAVMLLMDYWPLRRLKWRAVLEKIPFFVVGGILAIITYVSQDLAGGVTLPGDYGPGRVPLILCHNIIFYLHKIVWPINLSSHYAYPAPLGLSDPMVLAGVIGTCILIPLLVISARWTPAVLTGWLFFFVAIFPAMGIVKFTTVIAADKFAYLPSVGLLMILVWFLGRFCMAGKGALRRAAVVLLVLTLAGVEAVATRRHLVRWRDTVSLYEYMLTLTPDAVSLHNNLGTALQLQGKLDEAISHYRQVLRLSPNYAKTHDNLGIALYTQGKLDEAISHYRQALQIESNCAETHCNLGIALKSQGKLDEAIDHYHQALHIKPNYAKAHNNLGNVLSKQGKLDEAISHYHQALHIKPNYANAHNNLGNALSTQGKLDEAISHYHQALHIKPDFAMAHYNLGRALAMKGRHNGAIKRFREAVRLEPNWSMPLTRAAWLLATHPDPNVHDASQAVELAERAAKLTRYQDARILDTLAAAYAAAGQFDRAVTTAQAALALASADQADELANHIRKQLELYRQAKP